ncbi:thioredoxin family protein [Shewanella sp. SR44-3]|uniref:thioredoxin family protein n=1 Tax=unclassified Shewanella TaxID=196818 RepID=UPI0015F9C3ED|nr:thioredoxin family protein [Shewanella sp. SR44-3]MBB1270000.1 thioredoxin family protein [Shewanella sp. SR44-3]
MTNEMLIGELTPEMMLKLPVFSDSYQDYQLDADKLTDLNELTQDTEIVTIVGTWCPDCYREVPRLIKVLACLNSPHITARYIGVDRAKLDEQGLAAKFEFSRIPTIIIKQNNQEVGRIIERPATSLEQALLDILF